MVAAGDRIDAADITGIEDYTISKPLVRLSQAVAQTGIANNTITAVSFSSEIVDTHNFHDTATNNSRITPTVAGYYRLNAGISVAGATDYTFVECWFRKNGSGGYPPAARFTPSAVNSTLVLTTSAIMEFDGSTDYVELVWRVNRTGAGTGSITVSSQYTSVLECEFIRPV